MTKRKDVKESEFRLRDYRVWYRVLYVASEVQAAFSRLRRLIVVVTKKEPYQLNGAVELWRDWVNAYTCQKIKKKI